MYKQKVITGRGNLARTAMNVYVNEHSAKRYRKINRAIASENGQYAQAMMKQLDDAALELCGHPYRSGAVRIFAAACVFHNLSEGALKAVRGYLDGFTEDSLVRFDGLYQAAKDHFPAVIDVE